MFDQIPTDVVVIDGKSTDGSRLIAEDTGVRVLSQTGSGIAQARNQGVEALDTDVVTFLDHDDEWLSHKLAVQHHLLAGDDGLDLCVSLLDRRASAVLVHPNLADRLDGEPTPGYTPSTLAVRRSAFDSIGGFDAEYGIGADLDWFARAIDSDHRIEVIPQTLVIKYLHQTNASSHVRESRSSTFRALRASIERKRHLDD